ncbi:MAG: acyl-ACP--UDP-N-acetylglucosamine O-acyltransferase [Gammaproteobacteria bacterium]|nr:acyl-ACP--UDP-N-acetylglucosamine O-acyltransferase [Gammaproteobacteria bacterium]
MIHPTAIIDPSVELGANVKVGPYSIIDKGVEIDDGCEIGPHVVIRGDTSIGKDTRIFQFSSIGEEPQDKKYDGEKTRLEIGARNVIRESCTINRGTAQDAGITKIGDDNWIMAYVHIAHDCVVGNNTILANNTSLAGHAIIGDYTILGGFTLVHQFCRIGAHSFSAMGSAIAKDVPPFVMVAGNSAKAHGLNSEGLKRRGFSADEIKSIKEAYRIIYRSGNTMEKAKEILSELSRKSSSIRLMSDFLNQVTRGIVR